MKTLKELFDNEVDLVGRRFVSHAREDVVYEVLKLRQVVHELKEGEIDSKGRVSSEPYEITKVVNLQYLNPGGLKQRNILISRLYEDREATEQEIETARKTHM